MKSVEFFVAFIPWLFATNLLEELDESLFDNEIVLLDDIEDDETLTIVKYNWKFSLLQFISPSKDNKFVYLHENQTPLSPKKTSHER